MTSGTPAPGRVNPPVLLAYGRLCLQAGHIARLRDVLERIEPPGADWMPDQLLALVGLAEKSGTFRLAATVLDTALARDRIPIGLALHLLRSAHAAGDARRSARLRDLLEAKVPDADRPAFRCRSLMLLHGPSGALARLRRVPQGRRSPAAAEALAELLLQAGERALCLRYLRMCRRRWPNASALLRQQIAAMIRFGAADEALALLDGLPARRQGAAIQRLRIQALSALGRLGEVRALLDGATQLQLNQIGGQLQIMLALAEGDACAAARLVPLAAAQTGRSDRAVPQFRFSQLGAQLAELQLLDSIEAAATCPADIAGLHRGFYFPARRKVGAWQAEAAAAQPGPGAGGIPRRILQYWDSVEVPGSTAQVMASWEAVPGYSYRRFDRPSAIAYLRDRFGEAHLRAFLLANGPAEESDFLRLCLLLAEGGIYADADTLLAGDPETLRGAGAGMVLYRESFGAVGNTVMAAAPGHPLLQQAVDMALAALRARENDITWAKTGPGLLTRATALHLEETAGQPGGPDLRLLPEQAVLRVVQMHMALPYKAAPAYWNRPDGHPPAEITAVLDAALGATAVPA
ncbi:glycosyltransferase family 32 protein [Poseidonocella sp. HB161398]|uniref:glycosyltransferase family 32 protein n=1 Tax=Poseidonocella sp. HB161398 TaxID=2320855 RepID=UPI001486F978|nr:glycosyltransferase [Poseidonocella sp. HB161398]